MMPRSTLWMKITCVRCGTACLPMAASAWVWIDLPCCFSINTPSGKCYYSPPCVRKNEFIGADLCVRSVRVSEGVPMPSLQPHHVQQIHQLIHSGQKIQAIQVYREATGVSLAEAKQAVEEMALLEGTRPPSGMRSFDNPVLESKIRSLLAKGKKIDAVKIYREEYGISLAQAQDAVNRIEASMPRDSARGLPYESAIGRDPFEDDGALNRQRVVLAAAIMAVV